MSIHNSEALEVAHLNGYAAFISVSNSTCAAPVVTSQNYVPLKGSVANVVVKS